MAEDPPESLPAFQAVHWQMGKLGVDLRPHVFDKTLNKWLLLDSGSQCTAFPPDPGDKEDPKLFLRAVNGTRIKCFGYKNIEVKIGRKMYPFLAIKADVETPVLGWDFVKHHKLDLVWNNWGDLTVRDRKAKITSVLDFKSMPSEKSSRHRKLAKISSDPLPKPSGCSGHEAEILLGQLCAIEDLGEDFIEDMEEDINTLPNSPYKQLLAKFPGILKQSFKEEHTKNGIIHRINTMESATPCKTKVRRLLPGSPKALKAKKSWDQLVQLGIVEKVDPAKATTWSSALHFVDKPGCDVFRCVGDYRGLNQRTELDHYPLPHLRDFTKDIAGCSIFSKVDLRKAFHQILIDERDRHKTCVTTPWGLYNFRRLSMGMKNAAQSFQRLA